MFSPPATGVAAPNGNTGKHEVLTSKEEVKPKITPKLTRAQLLSRALKSCHKIKSHKKRAACERSARNRYGAKHKSKKKAHRSSSHTAAGRGR